jgi:ABC-type lipoprotein export system ATPase subunit
MSQEVISNNKEKIDVVLSEEGKNSLPILQLKNVSKTFTDQKKPLTILENVSFSLFEGEKVAIIGPSGSGKSTLLALLAGLDAPTSGEILVRGVPLASHDEKALAEYRNTTIGIIFQSFELVSPFTVRENVETPLLIASKSNDARVTELVNRVGLLERENSFPATLSGGEKQRVAIARALSQEPAIILADEPTGSLDRNTGGKVLELLLEEVSREGRTLVIITHDISIADKMDRVLVVENKTVHER